MSIATIFLIVLAVLILSVSCAAAAVAIDYEWGSRSNLLRILARVLQVIGILGILADEFIEFDGVANEFSRRIKSWTLRRLLRGLPILSKDIGYKPDWGNLEAHFRERWGVEHKGDLGILIPEKQSRKVYDGSGIVRQYLGWNVQAVDQDLTFNYYSGTWNWEFGEACIARVGQDEYVTVSSSVQRGMKDG